MSMAKRQMRDKPHAEKKEELFRMFFDDLAPLGVAARRTNLAVSDATLMIADERERRLAAIHESGTGKVRLF